MTGEEAHGQSGLPRRESFDDVAELYDRARPGYPDQLLKDIVALAGLSQASKILEIGCGTGQLTLPLARTGATIVAVELGTRLAAIARRNLAGFGNASVVNAAFEDWPPPDEPFDCVVSATAFHWVDPEIRLIKSARALRPGGLAAVVATHQVAGGTSGFDDAAQPCYAQWTGADPAFRLPVADMVVGEDELERSPLFGSVSVHRYVRELAYTSQSFADLLGTFSPELALTDVARDGLKACLGALIDSKFGGKIMKQYLNELQVAAVR